MATHKFVKVYLGTPENHSVTEFEVESDKTVSQKDSMASEISSLSNDGLYKSELTTIQT